VKWRRKLSSRLLLANLAVLGAGAVSFAVTFRLLAPEIFGRRLGAGGPPEGRGQGAGPGGSGLIETFNDSVDIALLVSLGVGVIVAAVIAWVVAQWIAVPIDEIRTTTKAIAEGNYDDRADGGGVEEFDALAHDVNQLADELAHTEQRRTRLLSDVTHEMRTPLASIDGFVEGAVDGVFTTSEMYEAVTDETARMVRLVEDLSVLSKTSEGALALEFLPIHLGDVAVAVVDRLRPRFNERDATLTPVVESNPVVLGDEGRLDQVLTNLLTNALGHVEDGGSVIVTVDQGTDAASVTVKDDGSGIAQDDIEYVFDRFFRGAGSQRRSGTGLGLSVARGIATAHGGTLKVFSDGAGHGATFVLTVPQTNASREDS
jgi:signal transduction histidine kinase